MTGDSYPPTILCILLWVLFLGFGIGKPGFNPREDAVLKTPSLEPSVTARNRMSARAAGSRNTETRAGVTRVFLHRAEAFGFRYGLFNPMVAGGMPISAEINVSSKPKGHGSYEKTFVATIM